MPGLEPSGAGVGVGSETLAARHLVESELGGDMSTSPAPVLPAGRGGVLDRQTSPFHSLGRVKQGDRAAASTAHTISLWKIPSIDSALIRQAALGIPPGFCWAG